MKKFLIIQTAFIGDVVLATSLLEKLHHHFPDAQIDFLLRKGNEPLLASHPFVNEVIVWDKKKNKLPNLLRTIRKVRRKKYDKVINVQRFAATGLLTVFSGGKEKIGFNKNPLSFLFSKKIKHIIRDDHSPWHETERNTELVRPFTDSVVFRPRLYPSEADEAKVIKYRANDLITISPASVWFTKQYPREKWIEFINALPANLMVYLLGAPGDFTLCDEIRTQCAHKAMVNLAGQLSFLESAALMKEAVMNYVNDSAPMHFASAVNAPVTAVYCSTLPSFGFGPLSERSSIVEIEEPLFCRPCGLHGRTACPLGHFNCAYKIKVDQLLITLAG